MRHPDVDRSLTTALARDLEAAGCGAGSLSGTLGTVAVDAMTRQIATHARRAALALGSHPASALVRCLMLGDAVEAHELDAALPSIGIAGLERLGLVDVDGTAARSTLAIRPYDGALGRSWWLASDHDELSGVRPLRDDHVLGAGGAGRTLAALLPSAPVASALDVGCGCGIITLHLRDVAERVVATDVSERALWCTTLSLALSGIDGVETRLGSMLEPVVGERFDLVASNPPFVITPRSDAVAVLEYRDGGRRGDDLMRDLLEGLPSVLERDGRAVMLGNWESHGDDAGLDRVGAWLGDRAAWVIERDAIEPQRYAELWARDGGLLPGDEAHGALLDAWSSDFEARDVTSIGLGWIVLGGARGAQRIERCTQQVALDAIGEHLEASFDAAAELQRIDDAALRASRLVVSTDVTEVRHLRPGAAGPTAIELRQGGGLARTVLVDTGLAALVGASDGELEVGALVAAIAELLDVDAPELEAELLPLVRELLTTGMLTPAR